MNPHPKDEVPDKFWSQRRRLFTKFDEGIQLDKESWFSVTPEAIANHIASHQVGGSDEHVVLDPFCGCGGNAIAFAMRPEVKLVVAADIDMKKLQMAANNARIYGVPKDKLVFVNLNVFSILSSYDGGKLVKSTKNGTSSKINTSKAAQNTAYQIG